MDKRLAWGLVLSTPIILLLVLAPSFISFEGSSPKRTARKGLDDIDLLLRGLSETSPSTRTESSVPVAPPRRVEPRQSVAQPPAAVAVIDPTPKLGELDQKLSRVETGVGNNDRKIDEVVIAVEGVEDIVVRGVNTLRRQHQFMARAQERDTQRIMRGQSFIQERLDGIETQSRVTNAFRDQSLGEVRGRLDALLDDIRSR